MHVDVKYGTGYVSVRVPDRYATTIIRPEYTPGLQSPERQLREALERPIGSPALREAIADRRTVGIVFSDITRATPNSVILPPILETLALAGIRDENITLFNATGTHRTNAKDELVELLGATIADRFRIVQNDISRKDEFTHVGTTSTGNAVWLNRDLIACDLRILTGYIEPHFFAGFSGGGKAIMPGCAALETILRNHGAENIDHPGATWGELDANPIAREVLEAQAMAGDSFLVNVTLNRDREITGVFAGDVHEAHRAGCTLVRTQAMQSVSGTFDLVITSNAGYPLDRNLYQSVKGMSAAERVVRDGGAIIVCAECRDGVPQDGRYGQILSSTDSPAKILGDIRSGQLHSQDVWQAHIHSRIAERAEIHLYSGGLRTEQIRKAHCTPVDSIDERIEHLLLEFGDRASVCVLPEGPETIPYVPESANARPT